MKAFRPGTLLWLPTSALVWLLTLSGLAMPSDGFGLNAGAQTGTAGLYDSNPNHIWNRVHRRLHVRVGAGGEEYGEDEVDPLRWSGTKHLLTGTSHTQALDVLDEFLSTRAERLVTDPVARAVFQHDLWTIFDWVAASQQGFPEARQNLASRLARVLRRVALTKAQIARLPDTYASAVASRAFADRYVGSQRIRAFLPPDMFDPNGTWIGIGRSRLAFFSGPGDQSIAHLHTAESSRSAFSIFLSVPAGRAATLSYLQTLWDFPQPYLPEHPFPADGERRVALNPRLPEFPAGTRVALVRKMLLIDDAGQIVPTNLTEAVQIRVFVFMVPASPVRVPSGDQEFFEFRMRRRLLFSGKSGGLHAVEPDETGFITFSAMGHDLFENRPQPVRGRAILDGCVSCHSEPNIRSLRSAFRLLKPYSFFDYRITRGQFDIAAELKARRPDWTLLQQLWRAKSMVTRPASSP